MSSPRPLVRVAVGDADALSRSGWPGVFAGDPATRVVAVVDEVRDLPDAARDADVAVFSVRSDPGPAFEAVPLLPDGVVAVLLVPAAAPSTVARSLSLGVTGLLVHGRFDAVDLARTVRGCAAGETHLATTAPAALLSVPAPIALTPRETEVMELVSAGLSNAQVAHRVHLSEKTVKNLLTRVFVKLEASNRAQAAAVFLGRADLGRVS